MPHRLALGTVQFGLTYGIANESGQVSAAEAARILEVARAAGVDTLDTAIAYGDSEARLGEIGVGGWRVVTKLPPVPREVTDIGGWVDDEVRGSLRRLRVSRLTGLLLHRAADLSERDGLHAALVRARERGQVEKVGVSIYGPEELDRLARIALDLVQAPFNVLDRRLATSGWLRRLHDAGVEVHTRSAFLQGLLLMPAEKRPRYFDRWAPLWRRWDAWLRASGFTALEASLAFALATPGVARVVVGVDSATQLREILAACATRVVAIPDDLSSDDPGLISPVNWRAP